ncbi:MAG: pentapeptide repeat-containing protein, partial [Anaerolineae bacterium]|nr:pentapeptide repeat-containing protein [Gloeobacterales cyanobacterium ES-bin-313]
MANQTVKSAAELLHLYAAGHREFRQAVLIGANLRGAVLSGAILEEANLSGANLYG